MVAIEMPPFNALGGADQIGDNAPVQFYKLNKNKQKQM
jgi:hypothetical protein